MLIHVFCMIAVYFYYALISFPEYFLFLFFCFENLSLTKSLSLFSVNFFLKWIICDRVLARQIVVPGEIYVKCFKNWDSDDNCLFNTKIFHWFCNFWDWSAGYLDSILTWVQRWKFSRFPIRVPCVVALASSACVNKKTKIITEFTRKDPFLHLKWAN